MLSAIIFDFDGIIVDSEPLHFRAFNEVLCSEGKSISWDDYCSTYIGFDDRDAFREAYKANGEALASKKLTELIEQKAELLQRFIENGEAVPLPGAVELIKSIPSRLPVALLSSLSRWLQQEFKLPVDASDFDESALPNFLRMKVIETHGDEIVKIHTSVSDEHRQNLQMSSAELALAKWTLAPQKKWPGDTLPEFIVANDAAQTRGYPALTDERTGVGRKAFLCPIEAERSHQAGLARLFRIQQADQVKYVEKRPPLTPTLQLTLSAIDSDFLLDLVNVSAVEALTHNGRISIRDAQVFAERAAYARTVLYETLDENARLLETMIEQREAIVSAIAGLSADFDTLHDLEMQLAFLFRPGFLQTRDVFGRYPRYLKAMQMRIQRVRNNPKADLRKLEEIEPFQSRLSEKLLESENISEAYGLLEFAMLLEEFRVNRFAPEIKTPQKISAQRLEEAWQNLQ